MCSFLAAICAHLKKKTTCVYLRYCFYTIVFCLLSNALESKKALHMATRTSIFRLKAARKFGFSLAPWRRLNSKQIKIVSKVRRKLNNQAKNQEMKRKKSQFFYHTRAKKLMGLLYGKLQTSYLVTLFKKASTIKGNALANFFSALEARLDTTLYRVHFAPTLQAVRQLISHQKVCVNNSVITKPGYILHPGDVVSIAPHAFADVGQNIQQFLHAKNTQTASHNVGLLQPFRQRRRKKCTAMYPKRLSTCMKPFLMHVRSKNHLLLLKEIHAQRKNVLEKKTLTKAKRSHMCLKLRFKMRLHMMKIKRYKRFTLRFTLNAEKKLRITRPSTRALRLRFQRTATGMPVKKWLVHASKNTNEWIKKPKKTVHSLKTPASLALAMKIQKIQDRSTQKQQFKKPGKKYSFRFRIKKVFYKPTHVEVNYHTLHIVYLFSPQHLYFPIKLDLQHVAGAFKR